MSDRGAGDGGPAYTLHWRDGRREVVHGVDIAAAMNAAGYGAGALAALDFYALGDDSKYEWSATVRRWLAARSHPEGGEK